MPKITFSHAYTKLMVNGKPSPTAILLQTISITLDQLSKEFIDYDTDCGLYKLAYDSLYLMLIFRKPDGNIFTTLRPQWGRFGNKQLYYDNLIGREFTVAVEEKEVHHG